MNKNDIKKGLGCCSNPSINSCKDCPYSKDGNFSCSSGRLSKDAINLITEQEKEIDKLKSENENLEENLDMLIKEKKEDYAFEKKQAKIDVLNKLQAHLYAVYGTNTAYPYYVYGTNHVPLGNKTAEDIVKNIDELIKEVQNAEDKS